MKLKREENRGDTTLIEIIIPSNITEIEDGSFDGCENLEEITFLPDSQLKLIWKKFATLNRFRIETSASVTQAPNCRRPSD